jgi:hypothetical protein
LDFVDDLGLLAANAAGIKKLFDIVVQFAQDLCVDRNPLKSAYT